MIDIPDYIKDSDLPPEVAFNMLKDDTRNWEQVYGAVWFMAEDGVLCQRRYRMWQTTEIIRHETLRRTM